MLNNRSHLYSEFI